MTGERLDASLAGSFKSRKMMVRLPMFSADFDACRLVSTGRRDGRMIAASHHANTTWQSRFHLMPRQLDKGRTAPGPILYIAAASSESAPSRVCQKDLKYGKRTLTA